MRWSKLKSLVEENFCEEVSSRVSIFSTTYGGCSCGRAWITVDKKEIANFCTRAVYSGPASKESAQKFNQMPVDHGEFSRQDAYHACWAITHELNIEDALVDHDPLVQSLAVLDKRVTSKRLLKLDRSKLHPLARKLLDFRLQSV